MISCTLNVPKFPYGYDGLVTVEVPLVGGSPKLQSQSVITPPRGDTIVDRSVNCVLNPTQTVSTVNNAVGFGLTMTVWTIVSVPPLLSMIIKVTL